MNEHQAKTGMNIYTYMKNLDENLDEHLDEHLDENLDEN